MTNIIDICRSAWNASRKDSQPPYDELIEDYRTLLTAKAEAVIASGMPELNPFTDFELGVERLRMEAITKKSAAPPKKPHVEVPAVKRSAKAVVKKGKK